MLMTRKTEFRQKGEWSHVAEGGVSFTVGNKFNATITWRRHRIVNPTNKLVAPS